MPKVDLDAIARRTRTGYPDPFHKEVQGRWWKRIAPPPGLPNLARAMYAGAGRMVEPAALA